MKNVKVNWQGQEVEVQMGAITFGVMRDILNNTEFKDDGQMPVNAGDFMAKVVCGSMVSGGVFAPTLENIEKMSYTDVKRMFDAAMADNPLA